MYHGTDPSRPSLPFLQDGDTLGLMVTKQRELSFYVNGKLVGVVATEVPNEVYGFVDLHFSFSLPVELIPDVQEVRSHISISFD